MNAHPTEKLSEYIDDELTAGERAAIETHVLSCPQCAKIVEDLRAVVSAASAVEDAPPASDLWPVIARQLDPRSQLPRVVAIDSRRAPRRFSFSIHQLAAASLAVALLSAGAVWMAIRDDGETGGSRMASAPVASEEPITGAAVSAGSEEPAAGVVEEPIAGVTVADRGDPIGSAEYEAAVADLERLLDQAAIDPEIRKAIDENLTVIDEAIRQTRRALEEDPNDAYLNTHLASTMQRKIDVLQDATRLARASI